MAARTRTYVPQRQIFPAIAASMSESGIRRSSQERRCGHDLAGLAIAALHDFKIEPRLLYLGSSRCRADPFNGRDGTALEGADGKDTGPHGFAINMYGAGTA